MEETPRSSYNNDGGVSPRPPPPNTPPPTAFSHHQPPFPHQNPPPPPHPFYDYPYPNPPIIRLQPWSSDLFECYRDPTNCLMTIIFPCITFGQVAEIVDTGNTVCFTSSMIYCSLLALSGLLSFTYRRRLRRHFNLMETPAPDWLIHFLCPLCALCQEYRELQIRGLCPVLGWNGVRDLPAARAMIMNAPVHQTMT